VPAEPPENGAQPAARELAIAIPHEKVAEYCRKCGIKRLAFFGSVIHGDFDPERSDVDVLVNFENGTPRGFYGKMPEELAAILGVRKVDLLTFASINRWIRNAVLAEAIDEYVAAF
jgi:predicted nucleotidyltransferase